jgi:hypothetical protein
MLTAAPLLAPTGVYISVVHLQFKLCRVVKQSTTSKAVPYIVTHDGRTIRYAAPEIKVKQPLLLLPPLVIVCALTVLCWRCGHRLVTRSRLTWRRARCLMSSSSRLATWPSSHKAETPDVWAFSCTVTVTQVCACNLLACVRVSPCLICAPCHRFFRHCAFA